MDYILQKQIFRPEFINRFDGVVAFRPLSQANLLDISQLLLKKISDNLKDKGITFETTKELKERIVQLSYNPSFGAREMRRVIQNKIENSLASGLLGGMIRRGDTIQISPDNFEIIKIKMGSFLNSSAN
jgi:ATP-dependent Clp protease ATP-binding subunit ClpA